MNDNLASVLIRKVSRFAFGAQRNVGRIEDLPYITSPAIQFVYQSKATLDGGGFTWADTPSPLTPNRPVHGNFAYYFRSISFSADIAGVDFNANLVETPQFKTFLQGDQNTVIFREPILMVDYLQNFAFRQVWFPSRFDDLVSASFEGSIIQGPNLIGKNSITLTAVISAQEIVDEHFVKVLKDGYPNAVVGE